MNKVPLIKPTLMGKKTIFKTDTIPTKGSNNIVTSDALAQALQDKVVNKEEEGEKTIVPTGDIIIGNLLEDGFYIADPTFLGTKLIKVETPVPGKFYYDRTTHIYYTFQGYSETGYKFKPVVLSNLTELTWQELKDLRDDSKLIPGSLYRITDYQCTTTQENTQSAGHQFDIVLLALSANKLAEEGWAMMHDNDVYDVTFADGVTKKCYIYNTGEIDHGNSVVSIVDITTLLGNPYNVVGEGWTVEIDEENKTAICSSLSENYNNENCPYNYFQNSNLSAWKVWYCLDNDTDRFAWADDSLDESTLASIYLHNRKGWDDTFIRDESNDITVNNISYYAWYNSNRDARYYTDILIPTTDEKVYFYDDDDKLHPMDIVNSFSIVSYTPAHEGTGEANGRGVIYRLIDEWNNDCPYDFKNILILNETYNNYCYAIIDNTNDNNLNEDPTLDGTKVKAIHVLCDNNDVLKPIAKGRFGNNPLVNIIFLNNSILADEYSNCVVSNGVPI